MVNLLPIFGVPISQLPRIPLEDAQDGAGFIAVGKFGTANPYIGALPIALVEELLGTSSGASTADVISRGAQGIVFGAGQNAAGAYTYTSTQDGPSLPYVCRSDLTLSGQLLNSTGILRVLYAYGQSWQTINPSPALSLAYLTTGLAAAQAAGDSAKAATFTALIDYMNAALALSEPHTVFKFCNTARQPLAQIGSPVAYSTAADFLGCDATTGGNPFGTLFAICLQKFARRDLAQVQPIFMLCASYPGTGLASLISPSNPLYVPAASGEQAWLAQEQMIALVNAFAAQYGLTPKHEAVVLVEGCGSGPVGSFRPLLDALLDDYDAMNLNGDGSVLQLWLNPTPANTNVTQEFAASEDQIQIGADRPDRAWNFGPWYWGLLNDYIHWAWLTICKAAEAAALAKHYQDTGVGFNGAPRMTVYVVPNGDGTSTLTIDISEPIPGRFIPVTVDPNLAITGLDAQWGLRAKTAAGTFLPITGLTVTGSRITGTVAGIMALGDEVSAGWYQIAPQAPGTHSPCWTNIKKAIGQSVILPSETVDCWLQAEAITLAAANLVAPPAVPTIDSIALSNTTAQANQTTQSTVGVLSAVTTGAVGTVTFTLGDNGGNFLLAGDGVTVQAIAGLPAGTFQLPVTATAASGLPLSQTFSIVSA
jgi:hypothetical protein